VRIGACRCAIRVLLLEQFMRQFVGFVAAAMALAALPAAHSHDTKADGAATHHPANLDPVQKEFGRTGDPKRIARTIHIDASDSMRFEPSRISVRQGETIRFVVRNRGKITHEAVLGTMADLQEHAAMMRRFPNMQHEEPFMVHVGPNQSGEMIWQFTRAGEFYFGCLVAGHFEAGMVGRIKVTTD